MDRQEIFEKVKLIVENQAKDLKRLGVDGNSRLKEDLGLDSLDGVDIAIELDKTFGVNTDNDDITTINNGTVDDVVDMVERLLIKEEKKKEWIKKHKNS